MWLNGVDIGHVGELHPRWRQQFELPQAPVLFELDAAALVQQALPSFTALPRQQPVRRDLSVVVNEWRELRVGGRCDQGITGRANDSIGTAFRCLPAGFQQFSHGGCRTQFEHST